MASKSLNHGESPPRNAAPGKAPPVMEGASQERRLASPVLSIGLAIALVAAAWIATILLKNVVSIAGFLFFYIGRGGERLVRRTMARRNRGHPEHPHCCILLYGSPSIPFGSIGDSLADFYRVCDLGAGRRMVQFVAETNGGRTPSRPR